MSGECGALKTCPNASPTTIDEVWVHGGCPDGTGAAAIALLHSMLSKRAISLTFLHYGDVAPSAKGKRVVVFDFSFDDESTLRLITEAVVFSVYDHHEGQEVVMNKYRSNCFFDNTRSGAVLAWKFFFGSSAIPLWVLCVEDRDLWKWELEQTKAFCTFLSYGTDGTPLGWLKILYDLSPEKLRIACDSLCGGDRISDWLGGETPGKLGTDWQIYISTGKRYAEVEEILIARQVKVFIKSKFCGFLTGVGNVTMLISDTCNSFLKSNPDYDVAMSWRFNSWSKTWDFSVRSRDGDKANCFTIAKKFGGGGHKRAAGFKLPGSQSIQKFLADNIRW